MFSQELIEGFQRLAAGDFSFRLSRDFTRDEDAAQAFSFNAAADDLGHFIREMQSNEQRLNRIAVEFERANREMQANEQRLNRVVDVISTALMQVGEGNLDVQIERDYKGDQIDVLAFLVDTTIGELRVQIGENKQRSAETQARLEALVAERTRDLSIASDVSRQITREMDLDILLPNLVKKTREGFGLYHVSVFLYEPQTQELLLEVGTGEEGKRMKLEAKSFHISAKPSLVAQTARERASEIANDVRESSDYFVNPYLPDTCAEAAFPMIVGDELVGVLDLHSEITNRFQESDVRIFTTLTEQIAIAVRNAQFYREQSYLVRELERADSVKSQFLASMSHELRTPLNAIINFTKLIAMGTAGPVTADQTKMLDTTLNSSKHLLQLINDVLDISKIQAGKLNLYIEDGVNLYNEIKAVTDMAEPLLQKQNSILVQPIQFIQNIDKNLPLITCDRRRVRQVLLNLLSNSIKFTEKGCVTLSVKSEEEQIIFAVQDMGPGISREMQDRIFEPFVQASDGIKSAQGTGLGLPISRSLVQAHGGDLWLESRVGEGSTFFFTLPFNLSTNNH